VHTNKVTTHNELTYYNQQGRLLGAATQTTGMASTKNLNCTWQVGCQLCWKTTPQVIQTQFPCTFFSLDPVHACSTHNLHRHRRSQNQTSTTPFVCACASLLARTMPLPARALFARRPRPDTCLIVPCLCRGRVRSVSTCLSCHYFRQPTPQPPARVLLCSLYLLCRSCPLFWMVVIATCAEILSLYPMPFLSLSSAQPSLSAPLQGLEHLV